MKLNKPSDRDVCFRNSRLISEAFTYIRLIWLKEFSPIFLFIEVISICIIMSPIHTPVGGGNAPFKFSLPTAIKNHQKKRRSRSFNLLGVHDTLSNIRYKYKHSRKPLSILTSHKTHSESEVRNPEESFKPMTGKYTGVILSTLPSEQTHNPCIYAQCRSTR